MAIANVSRRAVLAAMASLSLAGCGCSKKADKSDGSTKDRDSEKSEDEAFSFGGIGDTGSSDASQGLSVDGVYKKVATDSSGKEYRFLLVGMTFENDLDHDSQAPVSYVSCYQNGVKLSRCTKYSDSNAMKTLEPGYSISVCKGFLLDDEGQPVKVKIKSSNSSDYVYENTYPISHLDYTAL
jgi:hypothetical protein